MEYGRLDHSSDVDERTLREIYLPAFEASVKEAKVGAVMANSASIRRSGPDRWRAQPGGSRRGVILRAIIGWS